MSLTISFPSGLDVDESDTMQLVRQAVLFENSELLSDLIKENNWSLLKADRYGRTPLMLAAHNGREKALHVLLNASPESINMQGGGGKTALHFAAEAGEFGCAGALLGGGADASLLDFEGHCPLEGAQICGHTQLAAMLMESIQADSLKADDKHSELLAACVEGDKEKVHDILSSTLDKDLDVVINGRSVESHPALYVACQNGRLDVVERLLEAKEKHVLVQPQTLDTVLHAAISSQDVNVLNAILKKYPALISNCNVEGNSCLHWASQIGSVEIVRSILEFPFDPQYIKEVENNYGASYRLSIDVNGVDSECRTPLYVAVANGHQSLVEYMLSFRLPSLSGELFCPFQIDVYCNRGRTPLMLASFNQNLNMISVLLNHGADVNLPLGVLETEESVEEARCVGSGALAEAARADSLHIVHFLLGKGATDTDNRALQIAAQNKSEKIVRVLLCRLAHADPEYKVNKRNVDVGQVQIGQSLLPSSLCPSKAAMLSWSGAGLEQLAADWFISAALHVNTRLKTTRLALAAITRVDLSSNRLCIFPSLLFQMPSLRLLNLGGNLLKSIEVPSYYISSTSLETLILKENQLESLTPQLLSAFPCLSSLDVSFNKLTHLPEFIWLCPSLKELNASNNEISSLPNVNNRSRLTRTLNIGQSTGIADVNGDEECPSNVKEKTLIRQNVWMNEISLSKVDDEQLFPDFPVTSSGTLTTLNLSGNKLQIFPNGLACTCPRLLTLNLSHNSLSQLCPVPCMPAHLRNLDVSNNRIKHLFPASSSMHLVCHAVPPSQNTGPHHPSLGGRRRSPQRRDNRSRSKSAVRSQRSLSVSRGGESHTLLEEGCVHKRHDTLEWLKMLNVSGNALTHLEIFRGDRVFFPSLTVLDSSDNQLRTIPSQLSKMNALSVLTLSGNEHLETLPSELGVLARLWSLQLKGCNLKEPLNSMVNVDNCKTVEVVAYLKTILEESKTYRHLKLMFLGPTGSGKSTLWEAIKNEGVSKRSPVFSNCLRVAEFKLDPKRPKGEPQFGPVGFNAWDFTCSRREYQAIHQYLITRRALYIVTWRAPEGESALGEVTQWMVNIQARAPNACVVLVATHIDQIAQHPSHFPDGYLQKLEQTVRTRFMVPDADKRGLPRVSDVLFISGKSRSDIRLLCQTIYRSGWELRVGKERAMDTQVPSSYIALMKVVREMCIERRQREESNQRADPPMLTMDQLNEKAANRMLQKFGRPFRDDVEFSAAVSFLHDCGDIIHFEDASLRALYFTDPMWLCDIIAQAVCIRRSGQRSGALLPVDCLQPIFKQFKPIEGINIRNYVVDLLHKCEVAVICHSRILLIPSHLPDEYKLRADYPSTIIKLDTRISSWSVRHPGEKGKPLTGPLHQLLYRVSFDDRQNEDIPGSPVNIPNDLMFQFSYKREDQLRRIYSMSYIPSGFWPRLITRIVGDANVARAVEQLFYTDSLDDSKFLVAACQGNVKAEWMVWQSGIEMIVKGHSLFVLKQFFPLAEIRDVDYTSVDWMIHGEQRRWRPFKLEETSVIEMLFPSLSITCVGDGRRMEMRTDEIGSCRLLALVVDLVDTLLEDWYPSLGTRFVYSSEGELLVSRYIPCNGCAAENGIEKRVHDDTDMQTDMQRKNSCSRSKTLSDMRPSTKLFYAFSAEECMLASREDGYVECPTHGPIYTREIAPDTLFIDIEGSMLISPESIRSGRLLGRGAFGFVFRANVKTSSGEILDAAQKMLEPVDPGSGARGSAIAAYKAAAQKWERDGLEYACRAYCTSRQELNLLSRMRHLNVISLLGVCTRPLSLIVELAPLGALNNHLESYRKSGARLPLSVTRDTTTQMAKAIEYLHQQHIIYRDLKSENVLVWRYPPPFTTMVQEVLVKLGDYGISRSVLPSGGAKGFGGTEGFMAPEIVRFNGEEEYTQRVDCFSFGMFLYELLTLKLPFEGEEHVKERLLEGARPVLLPHELLYPTSLLDLMVICWAAHPDSRPTSSQIVSLCSAPEFTHILDVTLIEDANMPTHMIAVDTAEENDDDELDGQFWFPNDGGVSVMSCTQYGWLDARHISLDSQVLWLSHIRDTIWSVCEDGSVVCSSTSLQEIIKLNLPSMDGPLICAPKLLGTDILVMCSSHSLILLRLEENMNVFLLDRLELPLQTFTAITLNCSTARQIWTGHADGVISAHHIGSDDRFSFASSLSHPDAGGIISRMERNREENTVWATTDIGSRVFCWDLEKKTVVATLDVRKVMPASETIHTIDTDMARETIVTSLVVDERTDAAWVYIGTSRGVLIVAHAYTLQPVTACRPYSGPLSCLSLLEGTRMDEETSSRQTRGSTTTIESLGGLGWVRDRVSETVERFRSSPALSSNNAHSTLLVTMGTQYRSLTNRFVGCGPPLSDDVAAIIWRTDDWV